MASWPWRNPNTTDINRLETGLARFKPVSPVKNCLSWVNPPTLKAVMRGKRRANDRALKKVDINTEKLASSLLT
jgi:hypothetical protein